MEVDYLLVLWVRETPQRFSVMSRSDLVDYSAKKISGQVLKGQEVQFKWKREICVGLIIETGSKLEMTDLMESKIKSGTDEIQGQEPVEPSRKRKEVNKPASIAQQNKIRKLKTAVSKLGSSLGNTEEIESLKQEIILLKRENGELKEQCRAVNQELDRIKGEKTSTDLDLGNNVMVSKSALATMRTISSTMNIYARNLFRALFPTEDIVGRSLMGKGCNANKHSPKLDSVDSRRRDSIIDHALQTYGRKPGSELYKLGMKDLKKSLSALVQEMNKEAQGQEEQILENSAN